MLDISQLTVIETYPDGYLLLSIYGDTQYVTITEFNKLNEQGRIRNGINCPASRKKI